MHRTLHQPDSAIILGHRSLAQGQQTRSTKTIRDASDVLAQAYATRADFAAAYRYQQLLALLAGLGGVALLAGMLWRNVVLKQRANRRLNEKTSRFPPGATTSTAPCWRLKPCRANSFNARRWRA